MKYLFGNDLSEHVIKSLDSGSSNKVRSVLGSLLRTAEHVASRDIPIYLVLSAPWISPGGRLFLYGTRPPVEAIVKGSVVITPLAEVIFSRRTQIMGFLSELVIDEEGFDSKCFVRLYLANVDSNLDKIRMSIDWRY